MRRLFVPFTDMTSGAETYKHGRYLELDRTPTGLYDLDFNRAYHPSCVYNPNYECPVPPKENRLAVADPRRRAAAQPVTPILADFEAVHRRTIPSTWRARHS